MISLTGKKGEGNRHAVRRTSPSAHERDGAWTGSGRRRPALLRYGVVVPAVGAALLVKLLLDPLIVQDTPFLFVLTAVMVSAWYGGPGPGLLATGLSALITDYFFLYPAGEFLGPGLESAPLAVFVVEGALVCLLVGALRTARGRAEAHARAAVEARGRLQETEARFRALVEQVPAVTYTQNVGDKRLTYVSPQIGRMLGYSPEEQMAEPDHWLETMHADDRARVINEDRRTDETGGPFRVEYRRYARDGGMRWIRDEAVLVRDERGAPLCWQGIQHDITDQKKAEKRLRESEELYRTVVEQAAENIFLVDARTKRILRANASLHRSLGYTPRELRWLTIYDVVAHDRESIDRNALRVTSDPTYLGERRYRRKDGSEFFVEVSAGRISHGGGEVLCVVAHDVTGRKEAEEALRRSLSALLALYETGRILGSSLRKEEIGTRLLEIAQRFSDCTAAVISLRDDDGTLNAWRSVGPEAILASVRDEPGVEAARRAAVEKAGTVELRPQAPRADGLVGIFLPLRARDRAIGVMEVYVPATPGDAPSLETFSSLANQAAGALENARLYEELSGRERQLKELLGRLLTAQEEERRRVAYDIHDSLAQTAAAAYQQLQAFARRCPPPGTPDAEELDEALALVRRTVGEARQVIADLRPTVLDDFGLRAAVRLQADTLRSEGWEVCCGGSLGDERLPAEVETTLFRVAQEALTNVRKHANAPRVHVTLDHRGEDVRLVVRDEGRGFGPGETTGEAPGEKVGISGMRERVSLLGGRFEVRSGPEGGTSVMAEVPLTAPWRNLP